MSYQCDQCGRGFMFSSSLQKHKLIHTGDRPYKCEQCGTRFARSSTLRRHERTHTGERPYTCDRCDRDFTQSQSLTRHLRVQHNVGETGQPDAQSSELRPRRREFELLTCQRCTQTFSRACQLKQHMGCHGDETVSSSHGQEDRRFSCHFCQKIFVFDLKRHSRSQRPYSCEQCGKRFTLLGHKGHRTVLRFKCDQCGRTFSKSHHLKHHLSNFHREDRPFVCHICKKTFTQSSALEYHKCDRSKNRPYSCDECEKSFTRPYLLKMHRRSHTGANLYKCVRCKMAFTTALGLTMHRRRCGKGPARNALLQLRRQLVPLKTHRGDRSEAKQCFIAEEKSRRHKVTGEAAESCKVQSADHVLVYTVEMDSFQVEVELEMSCQVCAKTFNTKNQYYEHLRNHEIEITNE